MRETMPSDGIDVAHSQCGRETGDGDICGQPATVWALLDGEGWADFQATACEEHRDELLDHPSVRVTSDAPLLEDES